MPASVSSTSVPVPAQTYGNSLIFFNVYVRLLYNIMPKTYNAFHCFKHEFNVVGMLGAGRESSLQSARDGAAGPVRSSGRPAWLSASPVRCLRGSHTVRWRVLQDDQLGIYRDDARHGPTRPAKDYFCYILGS